MIGLAAVAIAIAAVAEPSAFGITAQGVSDIPLGNRLELFIGTFVGAITFSGSVIAFGKLAGKVDGKAKKLPGGHVLNASAAIISLVLLGFLGGIALWLGGLVRNAPALVNVPRKDLFLKLSAEGRLAVVAPTRTFLAWVIALVMLLFLYILEGSARVAVLQDDMLPSWPVFVFLGLVFATLPFFLLATTRAVDRAARAEGLLGETGR
jgi:hypothetical protein